MYLAASAYVSSWHSSAGNPPSGGQEVPGVILKYRTTRVADDWEACCDRHRFVPGAFVWDGASWRCGQKRAVRQRIPAKRLQLDREAPRVPRRALRSGGAERSGGRCRRPRGQRLRRQERLPHRLALEADVGGMALQAAEGAGNTFAGFWHGGAFSRLATDIPIAQGRVDGGAIHASRTVRRSLGGAGRKAPVGRVGKPGELRADDHTTQ
jgi:hypothetical protein